MQFVCDSSGTCLEYMLPGVQVTAGLGFFLRSSHLGQSILNIVIPYLNGSIAFSVGLSEIVLKERLYLILSNLAK